MPTKEEHLSKAERNAALAFSLPLDSPATIDWALIMLFYAAVHYVESYFAQKGVHLHSHGARGKAIGLDPGLQKIYGEYEDLKYFAHQARYECTPLAAADVTDRAAPYFSIIKGHIMSLE